VLLYTALIQEQRKDKLVQTDARVCIIGMGYVGLTLAIALAMRGVKTTGVEINKDILGSIRMGEPHFKEAGIEVALKSCIASGKLSFSASVDSLDYDFVIITVGTPLNENGEVYFDGLLAAINGLPKFSSNHDVVVILRSTIAVGSSNALLNMLETKGITNVCFAPERTIEGEALKELYSLPQVIGANNNFAMEKTVDLFSVLTDKIVRVSSLEIAELAKLFNNTYRDMTFAIGNYFALIAQQFGSNGIEAIQAANLDYPRGGIPNPGFVGGPCLEKDPYILSFNEYATHEIPLLAQYNFTMMSRAFNETLVHAFSELVLKHVNGFSVVMSGLAFKGKPATSDLRGSMGIRLLKEIQEHREVEYLHDFEAYHHEVIRVTGIGLSQLPDIGTKKCLIILNNHESYSDLTVEYLGTFEKVIDIQGALTKYQLTNLNNIINFGSIAL